MMAKFAEFNKYYPYSRLAHFDFTFGCENYTPWHIIQGTGGQVLKELQNLLGHLQGIRSLKFNE